MRTKRQSCKTIAKSLITYRFIYFKKIMFYKPRGNFKHNTITLTLPSLLYPLTLSWYPPIYSSYTAGARRVLFLAQDKVKPQLQPPMLLHLSSSCSIWS